MKNSAVLRSGRGGKATMQDVADAVGVSKMAVSYVLSGQKKVSPATRDAVLAAVEDLKFELNPHAQRLANGHCLDTIGLIALWFDYGVASHKIRHIQSILNEQGFNVPLYGVGLKNRRDQDVQADAVAHVRRQKQRALVCAPAGFGAKALDELRRYQDEGGILVCYDHPVALDCDQVVFDRNDNTYRATRHLLELGHRSVGIAIHGFMANSQERLRGYHRAMREFGARSRPEWVFEGHDNIDYAEGGCHIAAQYLALQNRPTALCIINDYAALAFLSALERAGLQCPQQISVVGHDDHPLSRHYPVPLTTVSHPAEQIAQHTTQLLVSRINREFQGASRRITVQGELLVRNSTATAPAL